LALPNNHAEKVIQLVAGIDQLESLSPLFRALTGARGKSVKKTKITKHGSKNGAVLAKHRPIRQRA
ncbi:MAG TPA: hypothetical protein VGK57_06355, partial [Candidatus Binatia bacterium]